ncbi:MAG: valine--tRNA ligase [Candidatus Shikimatogenerans sp. JK-2022]|nr:valine--tRNA ligase [Candidatus Shikimatogenerans bostrichidophilus]
MIKKYNFKKYNKKIYRKWIKKKYFKTNYNKKKKPYYLLLPPPNITGDLHIGHILNFTILDIYARFKRMGGYNVCFIPGTDHASIATEIKIRKELKKKGIKKISKKKFKKKILNWAKKYNKIIINQLKDIGCSCDWKKFQYTMDKKNYNNVIKIFIFFYKKGMIYKKKRIVNWDINAKTTISDEEVIYKKKIQNLYYIKYFTENNKNYLVVATTRPETLFGDTALCINSKNKKYKKFKNKKFKVPIINRKIPLITDNKYVKKKLGTGCLKVTPAHSKKDFKIYKKNKKKIKIINIFKENGILNKNCLKYSGLDRFKARKKIVKELKKLGLLIKKEKIKSKIGYSERTKTIIEYKLSLQWFLKIKNFIKPTLKKIKKIKFYPKKKYNNLLLKWLKTIKDWNISRQLIWGHKIPVYYYKNKKIITKNIKNFIKKVKKKYNLKIKKKLIKQDKNVLDTWFSSWILPISGINGFSKKQKEYNYFYPINLLVTGYDILFFWVIRMIMFSIFFKKKIPFKKVYFTGIIRDRKKRKISKSLGNYKNLNLLLKKYGADGIRVGILINNNENDLIYNENLLEKGRNFINKIWNSYILIKKIKSYKNIKKEKKENFLIIKWFNNILNYNIFKLNKLLKEKKIYKSLILIKKLFKKKFCSIYLEYIKFKKNKIYKNIKNYTLKFFNILLKILHPFIPFITEYIWNILNKKKRKDITISKWPKVKKFNKEKIKKFNYTLKFIKFLNKKKFKSKKILIYIKKKDLYKFKKNFYIKFLYKFSIIKKIKIKKKKLKDLIFFFYKKIKIFFLKKEIIKKDLNLEKIKKKINFYKKYLLNIKFKLKNKNFLLFAPKHIIKLERKKKKDIKKKIKNFKKLILFI